MNMNWPAPLLQPNPKEDCSFYSVAYLCRCFGFSEVTVDDAKAFRQRTGWKEIHYPEELGLSMDCYWRHKTDEEVKRFWLGQKQRTWVQDHLNQKQIALVCVHRVPEMGHIVVLLESDGFGVLLADPAKGHVRETWDWFLGIGPGTHGCHRIDGWYSKE